MRCTLLSRSIVLIGLMLAGLHAMTACAPADRLAAPHTPSETETMSVTIRALRFDAPPTLHDARWPQAPATPLALNASQIARGDEVHEAGTFRVGFDDRALYLLTEFTDSDLVCTAQADGDTLYTRSDIAEWFIGPPPTTDASGATSGGWYLELHVSPRGLRTATLWLRPGLPELVMPPPFQADVRLRGTLNDASDRDQGWTAMMVLPWSSLRSIDPSLTPQSPLSMLVGRYNYSRYLPRDADGSAGPELTMYPPQPRTQFHLRPHHAPLTLLPRDNPGAQQP